MHTKKKLGEEYILNQRKKVLLGIMDTLILQWIKDKHMSGKDIASKILNQFNIFIGPGTLYPILHSLKKRNLVNMKIDKKSKLYFLTDKGKIASKSLIEDYSKIQKYINF